MCTSRIHPRRHAVAMLYLLIALIVLIPFVALAVDIGRAQAAKTEIQSCVDAAARYAVSGMQSSSTPLTTAIANARAIADESSVDGSPPTIDSADVIRGSFNDTTGVFSIDSHGDCVKVTAKQSLTRPGAFPMVMSLMRGNTQFSVSATAIARTSNTSVEISPPAAGNLWLAGMPDNTQFQNFRPDNSTVWDNSGTTSTPKQRPLEVKLSTIGAVAGNSIALEGISGTADFDGSGYNSADGNINRLAANGQDNASYPTNSANGISNVRAPIGGIVAVFMDDNAPNTTSAPTNLDFATTASRDYYSISPQLKQVFYIGDGKRSNGETQTIIVPSGATRVFFGMMDAWQWNDNVGNFQTKLYSHEAIQLVR